MNSRELFLQRRLVEHPVFLKVLRALPKDQIAYKPHDRSPSAEQLVWTLTTELKSCLEAAADFRTEWKIQPPPALDEMIPMFERWSNELNERVSKLDDTAWDRKIQLYFGGRLISEQPLGEFLWFILFDAVHHRGQLSAYLRPMGGKVPAIYGPSGDERPS
ncbi:MAG TPA: DinB family protein [Vicinamibacterales bacterium]|jgi:uncharacterized damage-inducible protein DinB|nr:DinB family protein [Vicinamibacterales bacterium]